MSEELGKFTPVVVRLEVSVVFLGAGELEPLPARVGPYSKAPLSLATSLACCTKALWAVSSQLEQVWTRDSLPTCVLYTFFLVHQLVICAEVAAHRRTPAHSAACRRLDATLWVVRLGARRACTTALAITLVVAVRTPRAGLCGLVHGQIAPLSLPLLWLPPSRHHEPVVRLGARTARTIVLAIALVVTAGHYEPEDLGWLTLSTCILCGLSFLVRKLVIYFKGEPRRAGRTTTNQRSACHRGSDLFHRGRRQNRGGFG
ncbi:uncharacterized protein [Dermacentor andersoni]|uniref:uncharacterized protein n=1 Tax=Dermacentor andersoni TaxID=34620 RepID=UPI003B3A3F5D